MIWFLSYWYWVEIIFNTRIYYSFFFLPDLVDFSREHSNYSASNTCRLCVYACVCIYIYICYNHSICFWYIINTCCHKHTENVGQIFLLTYFVCIYRSDRFLFWGLLVMESIYLFLTFCTEVMLPCISFINTDAFCQWDSHKGVDSRLQWWNITFVIINNSKMLLLNKTNKWLNVLWYF